MDAFDNLFNLTNYRDHPEQSNVVVFFFYKIPQGRYFEELLREENIDFESFEEQEPENRLLVAVYRRNLKSAIRINGMTYARFKKPFIPNPILKYAILAFTVMIILFAIWGYLST